MSKNLRNCMKIMDIYSRTKSPRIKKSILQEMSRNDCYFKAIFEIICNIANQKLSLDYSAKRKLKKCVGFMEKVMINPKSRRSRAALVKSQKGGGVFLAAIIPLLTTFVTSLIENAISKKSSTNTS